jgi:hypothetical protein
MKDKLQELETRIARLERTADRPLPFSQEWARDPKGYDPYRSVVKEDFNPRPMSERIVRPFVDETQYKVIQKFPRTPLVKWTKDFVYGDYIEGIFKTITKRSRAYDYELTYKRDGGVVISASLEGEHIFHIICTPDEVGSKISQSLAESIESVFNLRVPKGFIEKNKSIKDYLPFY